MKRFILFYTYLLYLIYTSRHDHDKGLHPTITTQCCLNPQIERPSGRKDVGPSLPPCLSYLIHISSHNFIIIITSAETRSLLDIGPHQGANNSRASAAQIQRLPTIPRSWDHPVGWRGGGWVIHKIRDTYLFPR